MDYFFISIGKFTIKITFKDSIPATIISYFVRDKIETEVFNYFKRFLLFEKPKKIDFEINFIDDPDNSTIRTYHNNKEYTPIYKMITDKKMNAFYHISISQFEIVFKKALYLILNKNHGFAIHSSSVKVGNGAYLFLGKSGAGKSTIASLLNKKYTTISDDITFIRKNNAKYYVFQTPIMEKAWWIKKSMSLFELKKVFFINKSNEFKLEKITSKNNIFIRLIEQSSAAQGDPKKLLKEAQNFAKAFKNNYNLYFAKDEEKTIKLIDLAIKTET